MDRSPIVFSKQALEAEINVIRKERFPWARKMMMQSLPGSTQYERFFSLCVHLTNELERLSILVVNAPGENITVNVSKHIHQPLDTPVFGPYCHQHSATWELKR